MGIRESARTNAVLVVIKLAVVLFVIVLGWLRESGTIGPGAGIRTRPAAKSGRFRTGQEAPGASMPRLDDVRHAGQAVGRGYRIDWAGRKRSACKRPASSTSRGRNVFVEEVRKLAEPHLPATPDETGPSARCCPSRGAKGAETGRILGAAGHAGPESLAAADRRRHPHALRALRPVGHHAGRGDRVLRLHRLRFDLDPCRGGPPSPARRAHRHPRFAGIVYASFTWPWRLVITGMVPYPRDRHQRRPSPPPCQRRGDEQPVLRRPRPDRRRRAGGHDQRAAGVVPQPGADLHGHGPRRPAARRCSARSIRGSARRTSPRWSRAW